MRTERERNALAHGTVGAYGRGCRCARCRLAWSAYMRVRRSRLGTIARAPRRTGLRAAPRGELHVFYRGKQVVVTAALTDLGATILDAAQARTGKSKGDVFERLLREHGADVAFA